MNTPTIRSLNGTPGHEHPAIRSLNEWIFDSREAQVSPLFLSSCFVFTSKWEGDHLRISCAKTDWFKFKQPWKTKSCLLVLLVGWLINIAMFYYDCVSLQSFTFSDCVSWNVRFGSEVSKSKLWELPAISGHLPLVRHCFHSFSLEGGRKLGQDVGLGVCNCTNECRFVASRHMTLSSHTCLDYCN